MAKKAAEKKAVEGGGATISAAGIPISKGAVILKPGSAKNYKTGDWRTFRPAIDQKKCIKCAKCWMNCPDAAIKRGADGSFTVDYDYCKGCLICHKICPVAAISYKVEEK